VIMQM